MHLLLDTNVLIPLEPTSPDDVEPQTGNAVDLLRLASEGGHRIAIHSASLLDLENDKDPTRLAMRTQLLRKYTTLAEPPPDTALPDEIPTAEHGTNDWVDHQLLAAVLADAVDYLVTEDVGLLRKAARIGLQDRVIPVADAIATLETLLNRVPTAPPTVVATRAHVLRLDDPIFGSFREEYKTFDAWISKCRREQRDCWVITGVDETYGGIAIIKPEGSEALGLSGGKVLKLCSFKVAEAHRGRRYGELLLKTVFEYCRANSFTHIYVEIFEHHEELIALFEDFGFLKTERQTSKTRSL